MLPQTEHKLIISDLQRRQEHSSENCNKCFAAWELARPIWKKVNSGSTSMSRFTNRAPLSVPDARSRISTRSDSYNKPSSRNGVDISDTTRSTRLFRSSRRLVNLTRWLGRRIRYVRKRRQRTIDICQMRIYPPWSSIL